MSNAVAIPFEHYEHIASAGIWDEFPYQRELSEADLAGMDDEQQALYKELNAGLPKLTPDTPPYPYLRLLLHLDPTDKEDLFVFQPALTRTPEEPFIPPVETDDNLAIMAENYLVSPVYIDEDATDEPVATTYDPEAPEPVHTPALAIEVLLPKSVRPIGLHQPIVDALGKLMVGFGLSWDTKSLEEISDVGTDFYTFKTEVPEETIDLALGDEVYPVPAGGLVAAGLRMAVCQTIRLAQWRPYIDKVKDDPGKLLELARREQEYLAALEADDQPAPRQLPNPEDVR